MIIVALLAVALLTVALISALALVVFCVRSEDRRGELPHHAPTRITRSVRSLTGLRVCGPGRAYLCQRPMRHNAPRRATCAHPAASRTHAIDDPASGRPGHDSPVMSELTRHGRRPA